MELYMKYIGVIILLVSLVVSLQAGKIVWNEDGTPKISGKAGKGCTDNIFDTKENNATKAKCS